MLPLPGAAVAQPAYPSKLVRWIVPYQPGGPADLLARIVTTKLAERWGHPVVVDNKPGGSTIIAAQEAMRAAPDGYTLLQTLDAMLAMNPSMFRKLPYNPQKDFSHICLLGGLPLILFVNSQLPVKSFEEFIAAVKAKPGAVSYGFSTHASQILGEQFCRTMGIQMLPVPYKGTADLVKGMISGEIASAFDSSTPYTGYLEQGRVRALASSGPNRSLALPNVPTLHELGVKGIETQIWHGVSAPAGLPAAIAEKIQNDVQQVLAMPDVRSKLLAAGLEPRPSTTAEYVKLIQDETVRLAPLIKSLGIQLD